MAYKDIAFYAGEVRDGKLTLEDAALALSEKTGGDLTLLGATRSIERWCPPVPAPPPEPWPPTVDRGEKLGLGGLIRRLEIAAFEAVAIDGTDYRQELATRLYSEWASRTADPQYRDPSYTPPSPEKQTLARQQASHIINLATWIKSVRADEV